MKNGLFITTSIKKVCATSQIEPAQTTSKTHIHQQKVMLTVWWDYKGIEFFEILPCDQAIK